MINTIINTEILSSETTTTSSFTLPSQNQTKTLFSFLKSTNNLCSFELFYKSIHTHLKQIFEINYFVVTNQNRIIFSKINTENNTNQYSNLPLSFDENEIVSLEKTTRPAANQLQKIVVSQEERKECFLYIPVRKSNKLATIYISISKNSYKKIDNQIINFLECFYETTLSAIIKLEKKQHDIKLATVFSAFQNIYFQATHEGIITAISPSVKTILDFEPKEIINKALHTFLLSKEKLENLFFILKERKKIKNYEVKVDSKFGVSKTLLCNFQVIETQVDKEGKPNGQILTIEGTAREISEAKKINQETQKSKKNIERILKSKKQFLANMGHEIRTPMNGIIGMIDLLRTTKLDKDQNHFLDTIEESSNNLLTILNNVLDLSKIEANKIPLKPEPFELKPLLNQLSLLFEKEIYEKALHLSIQVNKRTPPRIIADKGRLLQIFTYLLSNAIKYNIQNGKISISVDILKEEEGKLLLQGEIKDTGIGISEENQEFLFDSFSKLQHNYQKIASGTGLGLTIARQLVEIMGGTLQVWSKEREGSTFYFSFEALKSIEKNKNISVENNLLNKKQTVKKEIKWQNSFINDPLILLVDDNTTNLMVAKIILEKSGCQVITAINGKEAIHKIKNNKFELVFMDIQMPEMDGVTATRFIRRLKIHIPPIIALTAFTVAEEKERFINAGMDDYLPKPVKAEGLIQTTKQWIDKKFYNLNKSKIETMKSKNHKTKSALKAVTESLNSLPIVNTQTAQQLQKWGGRELVEESYQLFEKETKRLLLDAIKAHKQNDRKTLKLHVHTIKGSAATLGVDRMATIATKMDTMLKADIDAHVAEQMQAFEHSFEEYKSNYQIILNL